MLKIKLFAIAAFLALVSCAFLFSGSKSQAQSSENVKKGDEILEKIIFYKIWQQVQKPEEKSDLSGTLKSNALKTDVLTIDNSVLTG